LTYSVLSGGGGSPLPKNFTPLSAIRASSFGPSILTGSSPHFLNRGYAYGHSVPLHVREIGPLLLLGQGQVLVPTQHADF